MDDPEILPGRGRGTDEGGGGAGAPGEGLPPIRPLHPASHGPPRSAEDLPWPVAWRLARRELSGGLRGLRLLVVCVFLGTMTLAAIGTLTAAIERELDGRGQVLLGGDLEVAVYAREATPAELAAMRAVGRVSAGQRLQAM